MRLLKPLAEQGFPLAQYNLHLRYRRGQGVKQDNVYAHMWWNIVASSAKGDTSKVYEASSKYRDLVAKDMIPADISKAQKLAQECLSKKYKVCRVGFSSPSISHNHRRILRQLHLLNKEEGTSNPYPVHYNLLHVLHPLVACNLKHSNTYT